MSNKYPSLKILFVCYNLFVKLWGSVTGVNGEQPRGSADLEKPFAWAPRHVRAGTAQAFSFDCISIDCNQLGRKEKDNGNN